MFKFYLLPVIALILAPAHGLSLVKENSSGNIVLMPLVLEQDLSSGRSGGEGFQMVQSIVISRSQPSVLYMSTDTSQVWKSIDSGSRWTSVNSNFLSNGAVSLAVAPDNPEIVFAAGSYGVNRQRSKKFPKRVEGVYRSLDGGSNWDLVHQANFSRTVSKSDLIAITKLNNKKDRYKVYAGTQNRGLQVSEDTGETWNTVEEGLTGITDLEYNRKRQVLYIAAEQGLYLYEEKAGAQKVGTNLPERPIDIAVSADGGSVWVTVEGNGLYKSRDNAASFIRTDNRAAVTVVSSPANPKLLFTKASKSRPREPMVSLDGGETWVRSRLSLDLDPVFDVPSRHFWFSNPIAPHPVDSNIVYAASNGKGRLLKSTDSGKTWNYSGEGFTGARLKDIAFLPDGRLILGYTDHGLWMSQPDGRGPFRYLDVPVKSKKHSVASVIFVDGVIFALMGSWKEKTVYASRDMGKTWQDQSITPGNHKFIVTNSTNKRTIHVGRYRSTDLGKTWKTTEYVVLGTDRNGSLLGISVRDQDSSLYVSKDNGKTWRVLTENIPVRTGMIRDFAMVDQADDPVYFIATNQGVYRFKSGEWKLLGETQGFTADSHGRYSTGSLSVYPNSTLIVAGRNTPGFGRANGVFLSDDAGENWHKITDSFSSALTVWSMTFNPHNGDLYIGTSLGTLFLPGNLIDSYSNLHTGIGQQ